MGYNYILHKWEIGIHDSEKESDIKKNVTINAYSVHLAKMNKWNPISAYKRKGLIIINLST